MGKCKDEMIKLINGEVEKVYIISEFETHYDISKSLQVWKYDKEKDILSKDDVNNSKKLFELAQKNKSIMWQDVFSFDNLWLEKNGLYNSRTHELDERKIKNADPEMGLFFMQK